MIKVSVVIPTYNEELAIKENVQRILATLDEIEDTSELVLVNDGSVDNTLKIVQEMAENDQRIRIVSYGKNRGRGFAMKIGFKQARGEFVITTESDLNWGSEIIKQFVEELKKGDADIVIASPHIKGGGMVNVPFHRWLLSYLGNRVFALVLPGRRTMSTGMTRSYRKEVLDALDLESESKVLHVEILYKALDLGYRVKEVPATLTWKKPEPGEVVRKSHFKVRSIVSHLLMSLDVRPFLFFGIIGIILIALGIIAGFYLLFVSLGGTSVAGRPLLFFSILAIIGGMQMLIFGFLASQNRNIKRQIIRTQKLVKEFEKSDNEV
ncbi:MAG: hypothetical protein COU08_02425 [Candidatus Harrisonbacteria bacterium CG10_big_fil_rev_8_21_14_0_10_42_17]|uniref:Glycosyltransferase 2-like domain-containing protein n=1 Tax=Candidatus Harrisonbacteria bacterium CG10_big_fil_rev_8_21_14_0_10_42_17 TaxID=1974584 RepID=A0A2M6WI45_9BACT|nr:MAG: hypothetical protein COU08_02425 [Candidatus Harrisonbacteria bacterium CG10_big_fil_rev_8_21_14_0_10_42_17]